MAIDPDQMPRRPLSFGRDADAELQDFFDTASIGLHWVGADGTILRANAADYEPLGYSAEEYIGRNIAEFHVDAAVIRDILDRLGANERLVNYRARLRCKDGSFRHVLIDSSVLWRNGEFVHTRCFTRDDTDRVLAEEASRAQARRTAAITDALPVLISYVDRDLRYRFNNRAYEEWFGHKRAEIEGRTLEEVLGADAAAAVMPYARRALAGESLTFEAMVPYRAAGPRWVRVSYQPDVDDAGATLGFYAMVIDVSDEHAAGEKLAESDERYALATRATHDAIWDWDLAAGVTRWSTSLTHSFGWSPRSMETTEPWWADRIHPDDRERVTTSSQRALDGDVETWESEYRFAREDGAYRVVYDRAFILRDGEGRAVRMVGSMSDVTDRHEHEASLRESEARYRTLADALPSYVASFDAEGNAQFLNERWLQFSGRTLDEMLGYGWTEMMHPADLQAIREELIAAVSEKRQAQFEYRVRRHDGVWRWFLGSVAPIVRSDGSAAGGGVAASIDITDRKRGEGILEGERRSLELLASGAPLGDVLASLASTLDEISGGQAAAAILLLDDDGRLRHGAAPGLPDGYNLAIDGIEAREGVGTCAHAAATDRVVITPDIEHDERWRKLRDLPLAAGLRAAWSMPLRGHDGRVLGTFGTYYREIGRTPTDAEMHEVSVLAHTAAIAVERRRGEARVVESEARNRALISAMPALIVTTTTQGEIAFVSESYIEYTGLSLEQAKRWDEHQIIHADDLAQSMEVWGRALASGEPMQNEMRLRRHDGVYRWHLVSAVPSLSPTGEVDRWVTVNIDIDDRKRAEQALSYELVLNDTITQNASVALVMLNREGRVTFVNPAAEVLTGYEEDELLGQLLHQRAHFRRPDGAPFPVSECQIVRANSEAVPLVDHEEVFVRPDGTFYHVLCNASPLENEGERSGMLLELRDITEQKRAEARERFLEKATEAMNSSLEYDAMLSSLARFAVPDIADIGTVGVFAAGSGTFRSGTALADPRQADDVANIHIRGWPAGDGTGRRIGEVIAAGETLLIADAGAWAEQQAPDAEQRDRALSINARSLVCTPLMVRGAAGGIMTFAVTAASGRAYDEADKMLVAELGRRAGLALENARLFGDLKTAAEELQIANAAKDEFLGLVSHELKTPITTIYGNAEVLQRQGDRLDRDQRTSAVADIRHESERLQRIVDNLLVLARMEQAQKLQTEPMLAARTVRKVINEHCRRFPDRTVDIIDDAAPALAIGAPDAIEQVVRNLLINAEKYSPRGTEINVNLAIEQGSLAVRVLDRGQGIDANETEAVFTPFFRSPRASAVAPGAGIGLAVCKRLMEAQGGKIWALPREGGGSEFGFSLPAMTAEDLESEA